MLQATAADARMCLGTFFVLALHINSWSGGPILILRKTKTPDNERLPGVHENSYFIFEKQIMWSDTR